MFQDKIFLASQSPRRRELIGYLFKNTAILNPNFVEPQWSKGEKPADHLRLCIEEKLRQARPLWDAARGSGTTALLVADTVVVSRGRVLGKPRNAAHAREMLTGLAGGWHTVLTGFALQRANGNKITGIPPCLVSTEVRFRALSPAFIAAYVRTGEPMDKAGAYGLQEQGLQLVDRVSGPYTNVIGLPVEAIRAAARDMGFRA
jgi:septum formation protein